MTSRARRPGGWRANGSGDRRASALVAVESRLLADALAIVLRQEGLEVAICPLPDRRTEPRPVRRFDLAVTSRRLPADAAADLVIQVTDPSFPATAAASGLRADTLTDLVEAVRRLG